MHNCDLKCNAVDCYYNKNQECGAGAINIGGQSATSSDETICTTYVDKAKSSFVNSVEGLTTHVQNIKCEAYNCEYNKNKACFAKSVEITQCCESCKTFKCK